MKKTDKQRENWNAYMREYRKKCKQHPELLEKAKEKEKEFEDHFSAFEPEKQKEPKWREPTENPATEPQYQKEPEFYGVNIWGNSEQPKRKSNQDVLRDLFFILPNKTLRQISTYQYRVCGLREEFTTTNFWVCLRYSKFNYVIISPENTIENRQSKLLIIWCL